MEKELTNCKAEVLISGFFTGSLDESELIRLKKWLEEDPKHLARFNRIRSAWILAGKEIGTGNFDSDSSWNILKPRIITEENGAKSFRWKFFLRYAASLFICFSLGATLTLWWENRNITKTSVLAATEISVPLGSISTVTLPDGSRVWLNAGSKVIYQEDFGIDNREIQLEGEAFFDVYTNPEKPFIVKTSDISVRAFGTRFNVKAYPEEKAILTTLEEGKVDVVFHNDKNRSSVLLKPNEQLVFYKSDKNKKEEKTNTDKQSKEDPVLPPPDVKVEHVKVQLSTSWKDDKWVIDNMPLHLLAPDLERRFNLNIRIVSDDLNNYRITTTIANETAEQILKALSHAIPVDYTINKNKVELTLNKKNQDKFRNVLKNKI
ncbi:anti-sigma factor [Bacteroidia bacterium]|nr:anti-sigma factor [Bacteroidia bacterium]